MVNGGVFKVEIYAHRGFTGSFPENTMIAFKEAVKIGADGIETDVHITKDGVLCLIHDETVNRTSNSKGYIRDMTWEEVKKIDVSCKAVDVTNLEPPTRDTKPFGKPEKKEDATVTLLAECDYFTTEDVKLEGKVSFVADETSFNGILCLDGEAVLETNGEKLTLKKGMSAFVPAGTGEYTLNGKADLLRTRI